MSAETCAICTKWRRNLGYALGDFNGLKAKAARNPTPEMLDRLAAAKADVATSRELFDQHIDDSHPDGAPDAVGTPIPKFLSQPETPELIPDGRAKCGLCGRVVSRVGTRLRRHTDGKAGPCPNVAIPGEGFVLTEVPAVNLPQRGTARIPRDPSQPTRLDAGSNCRECGRWLPGERSLCGKCANTQGRAS